MKTYTTPVLTDMTLGEFEIDGEKHTVVVCTNTRYAAVKAK